MLFRSAMNFGGAVGRGAMITSRNRLGDEGEAGGAACEPLAMTMPAIQRNTTVAMRGRQRSWQRGIPGGFVTGDFLMREALRNADPRGTYRPNVPRQRGREQERSQLLADPPPTPAGTAYHAPRLEIGRAHV